MNTSYFRATFTALLACVIFTIAANAQTTYNGNADTSFGGAVGGGSVTLSNTATDLVFTFTRGTGSFNNYLVFYFDTKAGGATSLPTSGDIGNPFGARRAIVNEFGSGISSFPTGFGSDYAYALRVSGQDAASQVYTTPSGANANTLGFVSNISVTNNGNATATSYSWSIPLSTLNLSAGQTFNFVTTYLDPFGGGGADATFRSGETFGNTLSGTGFSNTAFTSTLSYTVTPVPEPSTWVAGILTACAVCFSRKRRFLRES